MINLKPEYAEMLHRLFTYYCPKAEIKAYGSRVNGDSHDGSDLDLAVITFNDKEKNIYTLRQLINDSNVPFLVDIHEYKYLPESFKKEIDKIAVPFFP